MQRTVEAVFEGGVFRPWEPVELADHQRVRLTVESTSEDADRELAAWEQVQAGQTEDIHELHELSQDRIHFVRRPGWKRRDPGH